ncbi:MAG: SocA family protein [Thermotogae bacterium]|nr:SocA family protein [Thermotogota bacterium]
MFSKSKEAVMYLLVNTGPITKTKLIKLLFLADKEALNHYGESITNLKYVKYFYGPYPREIEDILSDLYAHNYIYYTQELTFDGKLYYLVSPKQKIDPQDFKRLSESEKYILKKVATKFGMKTLGEILDIVYELEEVKNAEFGQRILVISM